MNFVGSNTNFGRSRRLLRRLFVPGGLGINKNYLGPGEGLDGRLLFLFGGPRRVNFFLSAWSETGGAAGLMRIFISRSSVQVFLLRFPPVISALKPGLFMKIFSRLKLPLGRERFPIVLVLLLKHVYSLVNIRYHGIIIGIILRGSIPVTLNLLIVTFSANKK